MKFSAPLTILNIFNVSAWNLLPLDLILLPIFNSVLNIIRIMVIIAYKKNLSMMTKYVYLIFLINLVYLLGIKFYYIQTRILIFACKRKSEKKKRSLFLFRGIFLFLESYLFARLHVRARYAIAVAELSSSARCERKTNRYSNEKRKKKKKTRRYANLAAVTIMRARTRAKN